LGRKRSEGERAEGKRQRAARIQNINEEEEP